MNGTGNTINGIMGERLRTARENKGFSRKKLVGILNHHEKAPAFALNSERELQEGTYRKWESGENPADVRWIPALCDVLGVDVGYLFGEYDEQTRTASDVSAITGLSEQALKTLQSMKLNYPNYLRVLNFLLYECRGYIHHLLSRILLCSELTLEYRVGNKRNIEAAKLEKLSAKAEKRDPEYAETLRGKAKALRISDKQLNSIRDKIGTRRYEAGEEFTRIMDICAKPENGLIPYDG